VNSLRYSDCTGESMLYGVPVAWYTLVYILSRYSEGCLRVYTTSVVYPSYNTVVYPWGSVYSKVKRATSSWSSLFYFLCVETYLYTALWLQNWGHLHQIRGTKVPKTVSRMWMQQFNSQESLTSEALKINSTVINQIWKKVDSPKVTAIPKSSSHTTKEKTESSSSN